MENKKLIHSNEYHLLRQSDIQKEMKQVVENLHMAAGSVRSEEHTSELQSR